MALLLVAFEHDKPEQDHSDLINRIEKYSHVRLTKSSYGIITDKDPEIVSEELKKYIDKNENLFVITLKRPYDSCGPSLANDWLYKELTF